MDPSRASIFGCGPARTATSLMMNTNLACSLLPEATLLPVFHRSHVSSELPSCVPFRRRDVDNVAEKSSYLLAAVSHLARARLLSAIRWMLRLVAGDHLN